MTEEDEREVIQLAQNLIDSLIEFKKSEQNIQEAVESAIQEGEYVIEEENHMEAINQEVAMDINEIREGLEAIERDIQMLKEMISNGEGSNHKSILNDIRDDLKQIKDLVSEVENDLGEIVEENNEVVSRIEDEANKMVIGYTELQAAENNYISRIDEMVQSVVKTARDSGNDQLKNLATELESHNEDIKQRINDIEQEERTVAKEMEEEQNILMENINIESEELENLRNDIEDNQIIVKQLESLAGAIEGKNIGIDNEDILKLSEMFTKLEDHLENISDEIREIEEAEEQTASDINDARSELFG